MAIAFDQFGGGATTTASTSFTVDITSAANGADVLLWVAWGASSASVTGTGWTVVGNLPTASTITCVILYRRKQTGDTTFTINTTSAKGSHAWASYTGLDTTTPYEFTSVAVNMLAKNGASVNVSTPSVAATNANRWGIGFFASRSSTSARKVITFTPPGAMTERADYNNSAASSSIWTGAEIADTAAQIGDTNSHSYTATASFSETYGGGALLYLVPGATGNTGSATGSWTVSSSTHTGSRISQGSSSGHGQTITATTSGTTVRSGSSSGHGQTITGSAAGSKTQQGSASGSVTVTGTASGTAIPSGSATGSVTITATTSGTAALQGSSTGSVTITGSAAGTTSKSGTGSGSITMTGSASGQSSHVGSSTGSVTITGVAQGYAPIVGGKAGSASGSWSVTGAAAGSAIPQGSSSGSWSITGNASGARGSQGSSTGAWTIHGVGISWIGHDGNAAGTVTMTGAAHGTIGPVEGDGYPVGPQALSLARSGSGLELSK